MNPLFARTLDSSMYELSQSVPKVHEVCQSPCTVHGHSWAMHVCASLTGWFPGQCPASPSLVLSVTPASSLCLLCGRIARNGGEESQNKNLHAQAPPD